MQKTADEKGIIFKPELIHLIPWDTDTYWTNRFLGANTYHVLTDPTDTYIGHIDRWGKFLSDNKDLIARSENEEINKGLDEIADYFKDKGFDVYRVLCQDIYVPAEEDEPATTAAYTNSLILNKHVYVALSGDDEQDKAALDTYQTALPDYTIHGIIGTQRRLSDKYVKAFCVLLNQFGIEYEASKVNPFATPGDSLRKRNY